MKIAIISDTHDDVENTKVALNQIKKEKISNLIHLGDLCSPFMIDLLKDFKVYMVFGNNDADIYRIMTKIQNLHFKVNDQMLELKLKGKLFALYHGTSSEITSALIHSNKYDYVLHGHTHIVRNEKIKNTTVLNPGTLNKALSKNKKSTYMILDLDNLKVELKQF